MKQKNTTITNIRLGNLSINILNLYNLFTANSITNFAHEHSFYEMHIILDGSAILNVENRLFNVNKNDVIIIPKNLHHFACTQSPEFQDCAFSFEFKNLDHSQKIRYEYQYFTEIFNTNKAIIVKIGNYERSLINTIFENTNSFSVYNVNKINLEIANLFLELSKKLNNAQNHKTEDSYIEPSDQSTIRKYKTKYFFQSLRHTKLTATIEDLASELFISSRQTSRFLKDTFGLSFKQMLTLYRMDHANQLLKTTQLSIEEISGIVGYSSYNGFLSAYKQHYGKTPQQTRQESIVPQ